MNCLGGARVGSTFVISVSTMTVGVLAATVSVALGSTAHISGYSAGSVNSAVTWEANVSPAVPSNKAPTHRHPALRVGWAHTVDLHSSRDHAGELHHVTITLISRTDTTKTATAAITLAVAQLRSTGHRLS